MCVCVHARGCRVHFVAAHGASSASFFSVTHSSFGKRGHCPSSGANRTKRSVRDARVDLGVLPSASTEMKLGNVAQPSLTIQIFFFFFNFSLKNNYSQGRV